MSHDTAALKDVLQRELREAFVSFTVPASGRRYNIHVDDWDAIKLHMSIAEAARVSPMNSPPKAR